MSVPQLYQSFLWTHDDNVITTLKAHICTFEQNLLRKYDVVPDSIDFSQDLLWGKIQEFSPAGFSAIKLFAKTLMEFRTIVENDQITLAKSALFEILILRLAAKCFMGSDNYVMTGGIKLRKYHLKKGLFGDIADEIQAFATGLKELSVEFKDISLLSALCLFSPDRPGLLEREKVARIQASFVITIQGHRYWANAPEKKVLPQVFAKMTELRSIAARGRDFANEPVVEHIYKLHEEVLCTKPEAYLREIMDSPGHLFLSEYELWSSSVSNRNALQFTHFAFLVEMREELKQEAKRKQEENLKRGE